MRCLVVGGSGQDGVLISAQLLAEGHHVCSLSRSRPPLKDVDHRAIDVDDHAAVDTLVAELRPDEVFYLAAHHRSSETNAPPLATDVVNCLSVNGSSFASVLEAISRHVPQARTVYASSCRVFGLGDGRLLDESAALSPACAYGVSKVAGMHIANLYRRERGLCVASAILFNHESELRSDSFLSKKLVLAALAARTDPTVRVSVGRLDDEADWGSARDYVAAMRAMARTRASGDFIIASGHLRSVRDFAAACFEALGLDWRRFVVADPDAARPRWRLRGDSTKIRRVTGWNPTLGFEEIVRDLVTRTDRHERKRPADFHPYL